jgi:hypothetical protein
LLLFLRSVILLKYLSFCPGVTARLNPTMHSKYSASFKVCLNSLEIFAARVVLSFLFPYMSIIIKLGEDNPSLFDRYLWENAGSALFLASK